MTEMLRHSIIGESEAMKALYEQLEQISGHDVPVLIEGESGTGKELFARAIHYNSHRKDNEFVVINCSAFPDSLLESELFGHMKGAFTGAIKEKQGLFEVADNGTFFMDEIGDMSPALQVKLLRVLQEGTFLKIGGVSPVKVNLRIIAATNQKLSKMVAEGNFREDLYYRINVIHLQLPPLRERRSDIDILANYFLQRIIERNHSEPMSFDEEALELMRQFRWPGNVRQLENEIEKASIFAKDNCIRVENLSKIVSSGGEVGAEESIAGIQYQLGMESLGDIKRRYFEVLEKKIIEEGLQKTKGNKTKCAKLLQISRGDLMRKITKYGFNKK